MNWNGKTPTKDEWREILENHAKWNRNEADGERADLSGANLRSAYLIGANLIGANLSSADLSGADLSGANLIGAYLIGANLIGANLRSADLSGADLRGAYLRSADLSGADLSGAIGAELAIAHTRILPEGQIIGWKKCAGNVIVKLSIPAEAKRSHAFGRKCRSEFADVLEVIGSDQGLSLHDARTIYTVGERVTCDKWNEDWMIECGGGIHFYLTKLEAEAHE